MSKSKLTDVEREALVGEYLQIEALSASLQARATQIKNRLADDLQDGSHAVGEVPVVVTTPMRPDKAKLAEAYPVEDYPDYYTTSLSAPAVRKAEGENVYSGYLVPGGRTVKIG